VTTRTAHAIRAWNGKRRVKGDYVIVVGSVTHRGGEDFGYRSEARASGPDYKASIASSSFALIPGATNVVKFTVTRLRDFTNELHAEFRGLPDGITATATNLSKGKDATLVFLAATNAPTFNGPIQLVLTDAITKEERNVQPASSAKARITEFPPVIRDCSSRAPTSFG
jgi:hypothetical protein